MARGPFDGRWVQEEVARSLAQAPASASACELRGDLRMHFRVPWLGFLSQWNWPVNTLGNFSGDWDVNWGYGILTHGHIEKTHKPVMSWTRLALEHESGCFVFAKAFWPLNCVCWGFGVSLSIAHALCMPQHRGEMSNMPGLSALYFFFVAGCAITQRSQRCLGVGFMTRLSTKDLNVSTR